MDSLEQLPKDASSKINSITMEEVKELIAMGANANSFEKLGDLAWVEVNRYMILEAGGIEVFAKAIEDEDENISTFAVRAIANTCYDNVEACKRLKQLNVFEPIAKILKSDNPTRLRIALGCISNLSFDDEDIATNFANMEEILEKLVQHCRHKQHNISIASLRVLGNLGCSQPNLKKMDDLDIHVLLIELLNDFKLEIIGELIYTFQALMDSGEIKRFFFVNNLIPSLYQIISNFQITQHSTEDSELDVDAILNKIFSFLVDIARDAQDRLEFKNHNCIPILIDWVRKSPIKTIVEGSAKTLSYLSLENQFLCFFHPLVKELVSWLKNKTEQVQISAIMILGNLSCSDEAAMYLTDVGATSALIEALSINDFTTDQSIGSSPGHDSETQGDNPHWISEFASNSEKEQLQIQRNQLCLGALQNISLVPAHKQLMLKHDIIPKILLLFSSRNDVLVHSAIGLLKSLLVTGEIALRRYIELDPELHRLLLLTNDSGKKKRPDHVFYEASRTVGVLINQAKDIMIESDILMFRNDEQSKHEIRWKILKAINNLFESKFSLLQGEALNIYLKLFQAISPAYQQKLAQELINLPGLIANLFKLIETYCSSTMTADKSNNSEMHLSSAETTRETPLDSTTPQNFSSAFVFFSTLLKYGSNALDPYSNQLIALSQNLKSTPTNSTEQESVRSFITECRNYLQPTTSN